MSERKLVRLRDRYPNTSRMTRWRWRRKEADFPDAIIINGSEYFDDAELTRWEESRRRQRQPSSAA